MPAIFFGAFVLRKKMGQRKSNCYNPNNKLLYLSIFLFLFLILRVYKLDFHDFWYDEYLTWGFSKKPFLATPPQLYYYFIHFWRMVFGASEFSLRLPSAIFSILSVYGTYLLGKQLFEYRVGILACSIMGLSSFQLWYAQEARCYSLILLFSVFSSYFLIKSLRDKKNILLVYFVITSAAGILTHYFYVTLVLTQLVFIVFSKKKQGLLLSPIFLLLIAMLCFPGKEGFMWQLHRMQSGFWINKPDWQSVIFTFENLTIGYHGTGLLYLLNNYICLLLFVYSLTVINIKTYKYSYLFSLFMFLVPLVFVFIFSHLFFSVYLDRAFIIITPYLYIILSSAIIRAPKKLVFFLIGILFILFLIADMRFYKDEISVGLKHQNGVYIKKPIKALGQYLEKNYSEDKDKLIITNPSLIAIKAYWKGCVSLSIFAFDPKIRDEDTKKQFVDDEYNIPYYKIPDLKFERLWVIYSDWGRTGNLDDNSRSVKKWLDENLRLLFSNNFDGSWLSIYTKK